jgi:hypothetical protein
MIWLPAIRNFLATVHGTLEIAVNFVPPMQRENDRMIMDEVVTGKFKTTEIKYVNACRLYLGVTFLSDISNAEGTEIRSEIINGIRPTIDTFKGLNSYQANPHKIAWACWRRALRLHTLESTYSFVTNLGRWNVTGEATFRKWRYYKCNLSSTVYFRKGNEYECYSSVGQNTYEFNGRIITDVPKGSVPVDLDLAGDTIILQPHSTITPKLHPSPPSSFELFVATLEPWEQELLQDVTFQYDVYHFVQMLITNNIVHTTSDGSAPNFVGTFGWVCSLATGQRIARNHGPAYGSRTSSFRAEAYGILSYLCLVYRAFEYTCNNLPAGLIIYTDAESVLKTLPKMLEWPFYFPSKTLAPEWDVLQAIVTRIKAFPVRPLLQWVEGHQDDNVAYNRLSLPAQLNVDADKIAGEYEYKPYQHPKAVPIISGITVQLHLKQGTITSKLKQVIRKAASATAMQKHLCMVNEWTDADFKCVDWETHGMSVRKHYTQKRFITKLVHDWLPLGHLISKYGQSLPIKCPSCDHQDEDRKHFITCPARKDWKNEMMQELDIYIRKNHTRPALASILKEVILSQLRNLSPTFSEHPALYHKLLNQQHRIGWHQLFLGRFATEWRILQDDYLTTIPSKKREHSGTIWVLSITTIIWKHMRSNWDERNGAQHGIDAATREATKYAQAFAETTALYSIRGQVTPRDRDLFYTTLEEHKLKEPTATGLRQWLNTWKPVILQSIKNSDRTGSHRIQTITNFYTRTNNTQTTNNRNLPNNPTTDITPHF